MTGKLKYIIIAVLLLLAGLYFYKKYNVPPAVDFSKVILSDIEGNPVKFSDFKGKKTIVSFGASWCPNCIDEMNALKPIRNTSLADVEIIIISDEPLETIQHFKERKGYPFTFLRMEGGFNSIGVFSIPTTYLFNPNQEIREQSVGFIDWEDPSVVEGMKELME